MRTIIVKVDLECSRCYAKIQKVLDRIRQKGEFVIDDIEYDGKNNRVIVKGPFDPNKLADKLCCKACKIIKDIEIVEPPPPKPPKKEKPQPPPPKKEEPKCQNCYQKQEKLSDEACQQTSMSGGRRS